MMKTPIEILLVIAILLIGSCCIFTPYSVEQQKQMEKENDK